MIDVRLERVLALSLVQRAEMGGDTATSGRFATPSYYCLISVLPPARCFQEPVSNEDIGRLNVLSVYTVQNIAGTARCIHSYTGTKFRAILFWITSGFFFYSDERTPTAFVSLQRGLTALTGAGRVSLSE